MTKKLFVLCSNGGDGSVGTHYTFNEEWIEKQRAKYNTDEDVDYECGIGIDGDGFHYDTLTVPDECTLQNLNIHYDCAEGDDE